MICLICFAVPIKDSLDMWRVGGDRESEPAGDLLLHVGDSKLQVLKVLRLIQIEWFGVDALRTVVTLKILQSKTWPCLFPDLLQRQRTSFRPEFYTLQRYSPYDNLRMQDYPAEAWRHLESMLKDVESMLAGIHLILSSSFICHHLSPPSLNHIESLCPCLLGLGDCVAERHDGGLLGAAEICVQTQTRQDGSWLAEDRAAQICCQTKMLKDWTRTARCTT